MILVKRFIRNWRSIMSFDDLVNFEPYSLDKDKKKRILTERLVELTSSHRKSCKSYDDILKVLQFDENKCQSYKDIPFLPVRLFKELELKSVSDDQVVKTITSSGTSGQKVSKIFLDRTTASNQQKTMVKIVSSFTGSERMPMIIIDCPSVIKDRNMFSARGAGILGFSIFGSKKIYALKDDMTLDVDAITDFLNRFKGERILLFGFTFMIWQYFYKELLRLKSQEIVFDLSDSILIHGGGWKKLISEAVSPEDFKASLTSVCGIERVHDYYGMVEQTGCIYMQCECGHLHASVFSDVIIRDPKDFSECKIGDKGIIQVVSTIPESYPGHSLLTEDEGVVLGIDDCPCGRKGKYFNVVGRIQKAEIRGCSDTFAAGRVSASDSNADEITYLVGSRSNVDNSRSVRPLKPFSDTIVDFCNEFSSLLLKDAHARQYPDVVTLGFWLRKASVLSMKDRFLCNESVYRTGRGTIFHIAPSNVPVNYAYSLFAGLLCGNSNIVRVPSKNFPQVEIINKLLLKALDIQPFFRPYITLVRYDRSKVINDDLSSICDLRVIWGGDSTIASLRESSIPARASDVTFADRYSLAVIDSDKFIESIEKDGFISGFVSDFYNDTYLSDQNACTSPRVIVWLGNHREEAKKAFWAGLNRFTNIKYALQPIQSVDKLSNLCLFAASDTNYEVVKVDSEDNLAYRVSVKRLEPQLMDYRGNSGFFYEFDCNEITELKDFCNDTRCQTLSMFGDESLIMPLLETGIKGIDRISKIGHTMDFDLIWDGYNLVERFTRSITIL
jgi:hypothetical protein